MELRVLNYFLAIAKEESISKAATILHITQPTLSRQIKELEEELDTVLFIRGNKKIALTEEGELFRKKAEKIVELADEVKTEFTLKNKIITGNIRIGSGESYVMELIAKTAKKLQNDYPDIHYHLHCGNSDEIMKRLDKDLCDFAVLIEPISINKYDYIKLPLVDTWGLLMRKDSPLAKQEFILPHDLKNIPLIIPDQELTKSMLTGWVGQDFDKLNIVSYYNLLYNASLMVKEEFGYALCIDRLINTSGNSDLHFVPLKPDLKVHLYVAWKKAHVFSEAAQLFIKTLRKLICEM